MPGAQEKWLQGWLGLSQTIIAFTRKDAPMPPRLRDFHMVGSGYDSRDKWQNLLIPKTSEGKPSVGGGSKLTYRYYLQDMAFACALELPRGQEEALAEALQHPVWSICLGRKTCVPTMPVFAGTYASEAEALAKAAKMAAERGRQESLRVLDKDGEDGEQMILNDVPLAFGLRKRYQDRRVRVVRNLAKLESENELSEDAAILE